MRWWFSLLLLTGCSMAGEKGTLALISVEQKQTMEWLKESAKTPDCLTIPWPECVQAPEAQPIQPELPSSSSPPSASSPP